MSQHKKHKTKKSTDSYALPILILTLGIILIGPNLYYKAQSFALSKKAENLFTNKVTDVPVITLNKETSINTNKVTDVPVITLNRESNSNIKKGLYSTPSDYIVGKKKIAQLELNERNVVFINGEIDETAPLIAQEILSRTANGTPLFLLINSPGGSVIDGMQVVSAIQGAKAPVYTVCMQLCASMAAMIHGYGKSRLMVDHSVLMFHEAAGGVQGSFNQIKSRFNLFDKLVGKMFYEIAMRSKHDPREFRIAMANELWLDAEDAVKENFADGLVAINVKSLGMGGFPQDNFSQSNKLKTKIDVNLKK